MTPPSPTSAVRYDPYDADIDNDPHPTWTRLQDEAPLHRNEEHGFWAISRWDDVRPALLDWDTYRWGRGTVLEIVKAGVDIPPGILLFEDPPLHDAHRAVLSRVFTPRRMLDLEPWVRGYAVKALDALVGREEFNIIAEFGVEIPLRTIGLLVGIPDDDQDAFRKTTDDAISTDGAPVSFDASTFDQVLSVLTDYVEWRSKNPSDDLMTELLHTRLERHVGPDWPIGEADLTYRVVLEGKPNFDCWFTPTLDDPAEAGVPTMGSGAGAMLATAMRVVNAVPYVVAAEPGSLRSLEMPLTLPRHALRA